ncbi:hypothetical protein AYI69_g515 [Smittium culicis]|uniref:Thermolabile hemolysin n=1 Tax=Smittium culicis TaxID=133412 RepID=A0A1R1YSU4_9FUNG|nr:hypothetical protein AYI69_g515 [Smittium culicis]
MGSACYNNNKLVEYKIDCYYPKYFFYYDDVHPTTTIHAIFGAVAAESIINSEIEYSTDFVKNAIEKYHIDTLYYVGEFGVVHNRTFFIDAAATSMGIKKIEKKLKAIEYENETGIRDMGFLYMYKKYF